MAQDKEAGFQQSFPSTVDIPLFGMPLQRGVGTGDQRYVNVLFEKIKNPGTGGESYYVIKRPGLANSTQPPAGAATGRGIYAWQGRIYSAFANKLYSGTTDLGVTLAGTSGRVWFTETAPTSSSQLLVVCDGADNYNITTGDVATQIDESDDAQYPTATLGPIVYMDDYLFQGKSTGAIWNCDSDSFASWTAGAFYSSSFYGDDLEALARVKEQLVGFGKKGTEFFFDNQTTPSPLMRITQNALQVGMAHRNSLAQAGDTLLWVSEAWGDGGRSVWQMDGISKISMVSNPTIDRFLAAEGSSISSCDAWIERINGHLTYVLNLSSADRTFVYDLEERMWCEWSNTATARFPGISATSLNGTVYVQDRTNGRIYTLLPTTYQDSGSNFTVTIQTDNYDFGTPFEKFQSGLWIIGDNTTGNLSVSEADDDYTTFNTARTIDMSSIHKFLAEGGSFHRRAYRLTYADNYALRLSKMSLQLDIGNA